MLGLVLVSPLERVVDSALARHNVPEWVRPYVYKYIRGNPIGAVRFAISLVDVKRKKGTVTKTHVILPNGKRFSIPSILKVLSLFFQGEDAIANIESAWSASSIVRNAVYEKHFAEMSEIDAKYARAIKNLAEGLGGGSTNAPDNSIACAFSYISSLSDWNERVFATGILLRYAYSRTFGSVFYKVFYPVSPEFMRSFGKAFGGKYKGAQWDTEEAERIVGNSSIDNERLIELTREILARILFSIDSNIWLAKELGIEKEVKLLGEVSVAYPFHRLEELGIRLDMKREIEAVRARSIRLKKEYRT